MELPAVSAMRNVDFTDHLMAEHASGLAMAWTGSDGRLRTRDMHVVYHEYLHRTKEQEHRHGSESMARKGWTQQTICVCLDPPQHSDDCTGKRGVLLHPGTHGPSIFDRVWERLDDIMDRLMNPGSEAEDGRDPGRAEATAYIIAIFENPANPDIQSVRAEAVARYQKRAAE